MASRGVSELLRRAVWWAADYAYAGLGQVRAITRRRSAREFRGGRLAPIVVIPGVYESWRFLTPLVVALHDRGHPVHVVEPLRHNRRPFDEGAEIVARLLDERDLHDVVLVAHSKGGLIGKRMMSATAAAWRVRGMVAIAAPFGGSRYARFLALPTLHAFSPRNAAILALARETEVNRRIVSVYARFDPHIPEGSELAGARNVVIETGGHFRVLAHPRVIAEVAAFSEPSPG
ncbi:alpha/beta hydrolase [Microbacterium oryzae]|uniref:esterase/lipase family protein n=1 Tax=Microbacterium oryzae TaxID=743009 RepID=UPI0025B1F54E|nr:alpha/beta fold hydrolase [Microbacterium oryzae]MDN3309383.1 alpha/beta hydrolase [Microbacterium oryzae]